MGKRKKEKSEEVEWKQGRDSWVKEYIEEGEEQQENIYILLQYMYVNKIINVISCLLCRSC